MRFSLRLNFHDHPSSRRIFPIGLTTLRLSVSMEAPAMMKLLPEKRPWLQSRNPVSIAHVLPLRMAPSAMTPSQPDVGLSSDHHSASSRCFSLNSCIT